VYTGTEDNLERNELYSRHEHQSPSPTAAPNKVTDVQLPERNYKAMVNEYCQKNYLPLPEYVTEFPDDSTGFVSVLTVCDKEYRSKPMAAKKKAEQNVAGKAALDIGLVTINERDYASGPKSTVNSSYTSSGGVGSECVSRFSSLASSSSRLTSLGSSRLGGHTGPLSSYSSLTKGGASVPENITANYKGMLQEFLAKRGLRNPQYSTGAGCGGRFVCTVTLTDPSSDEDVEFEGQGYANKKSAEQSAAKQAYTCLTQGI
jgi:dsRNA-specific ribonuclease